MSLFWIIYLATVAIVGGTIVAVAVHDRRDLIDEYETMPIGFIVAWLILTFTPILNIVVLIVGTSHLVLHTLKQRDEARRRDPKYAKKEPDTLCMMTRYDCECMNCQSDPRFPDQKSKPELETKTGI